jgi:hypothetical protein
MKIFFFAMTLIVAASCMKTREDYRQALDGIQKEEEAPNPDRARGSNDADGMGMNE